jgi:uncharacterized membrane-anchored protein
MNADRLQGLIQAAIAEGIVPGSAHIRAPQERPWPVVLLTALGAWLAAAPLLVALFMAFGKMFSGAASNVAPYVIGALILAGAIAVLRKTTLSLFVEQLALPALLVGGGSITVELLRDFSTSSAAAVVAALAIAIAFIVKRNWLRLLLGTLACAMIIFSLDQYQGSGQRADLWIALHIALAIWLMATGAPSLRFGTLESLSAGWALALLAGLAFWSGMTFLVDASLGGLAGGHTQSPLANLALRLISLALALGAAARLATVWPGLRKGWIGLASLMVLLLAWLMPSLGAVLLILAVCASSGRHRLAIAAGVAAAWIIGAFYYELSFPLADKALMMVGAGAWLGALAWSALRGKSLDAAQALPPESWRSRAGIALCALTVLVVANVGIWQKETLIAEGRPVFVELAPVDPRSLMQGDYMRLNFRVPEPTSTRARPSVVAKIDARGVATIDRLYSGGPLANDEIRIELTHGAQGWTLVTDAWYFKEGEAQRWSRARYGEFRVDTKGRALLVGMRGPALEPL